MLQKCAALPDAALQTGRGTDPVSVPLHRLITFSLDVDYFIAIPGTGKLILSGEVTNASKIVDHERMCRVLLLRFECAVVDQWDHHEHGDSGGKEE
jgi:hypothetical protein